MNNSNKNTAEFYDQNGYAIIDLLDETQHNELNTIVLTQITKAANKEGISQEINSVPLEKYHVLEISDEVHRRMLLPKNRLISLSETHQRMILNDYVHPIFVHSWGQPNGIIKIKYDSDFIIGGCIFRLIRPLKQDVSGVHSETTAGILPITIWIPLIGFDEQYSLNIAPATHKLEHPADAIYKVEGYIAKPYTDEYVNQFSFIRPNMKKGQAIVFHPNLLHGGSKNIGDLTRVSIEIRVFKGEEELS